MRQVGLALAACLVAGTFAAGQESNLTSGTKSKKPSAEAVAARLSEMQKAIEAQQQQIQHLVEQVQSRDGQIQELEQQMSHVQSSASQAQQAAEAATSRNAQEEQNITAIRSDISGLKSTAGDTALTIQETQKNVNASLENPLAVHYKGITITPGGFLAAEFVRRSRALAADVNTPFNSLTMPGASQSSLSEFFGSGRQSRISMLAEGRLQRTKLSGYVEADFLSASASSNNNQSNSYSLRQRQAWGQVALDNGFTFTGGQMWSLVTETKHGVDNRSEALPMTIDAQYTVGFSWARQVIWLEPDPEGAFDEYTRIGRAARKAGGSKPVVDGWRNFGEAAGIAEQGRSVTDVLPGDGIEIRGPAGILNACVCVNIQLWPVPLQSSQSLIALDQIECSVGMD
jgi:hypothetical protein